MKMINDNFNKSVKVDGDLSIPCCTKISGDLTVSKNLHLPGDLFVTGDIIVGGSTPIITTNPMVQFQHNRQVKRPEQGCIYGSGSIYCGGSIYCHDISLGINEAIPVCSVEVGEEIVCTFIDVRGTNNSTSSWWDYTGGIVYGKRIECAVLKCHHVIADRTAINVLITNIDPSIKSKKRNTNIIVKAPNDIGLADYPKIVVDHNNKNDDGIPPLLHNRGLGSSWHWGRNEFTKDIERFKGNIRRAVQERV